MAYEYDVFVSYKTGGVFEEWLHEHFLIFLKDYLKATLSRDARVFVDKSGISSGDAWPERIKRALVHSKCLIPIWSPPYFYSSWCMCECNVMLDREKRLGYRTTTNPGGLVIPVRIFDGEQFPDFAKNIHCFDCRNFARTGEGFKKTERYIKFQDHMLDWIPDVVDCINSAPSWSNEFEMWVEDSIEEIQHPTSDVSFKPPILE